MTIFLIAQQTQVVVFEREPDDYTFIWFLAALAVVLFIVFFWRIRRQGQS
jgi:hypothetical protein